jgi:hypothetical protein
MNTVDSPNGHTHEPEPPQQVNPYLDAIAERQPREIVDFEMDTDPYANMLPGISNIHAARTIGRGLEVGKRGNRAIMAISVFLLVVLLLPALLAVITQLGH